jgi:hypothetical protein
MSEFVHPSQFTSIGSATKKNAEAYWYEEPSMPGIIPASREKIPTPFSGSKQEIIDPCLHRVQFLRQQTFNALAKGDAI